MLALNASETISNNKMVFKFTSGYTGLFAIIFSLWSYLSFFRPYYDINVFLLFTVLFVFLSMVFTEIFQGNISIEKSRAKSSYLLKSAFFRFFALLTTFYFFYFIIQNHYYFNSANFAITRTFYNYIFYAYLLFGIPYIYLTLRYKSNQSYEINDYGVLLMIFYKSLFFSNQKRLKNRRIKKVLLAYLLNFFFLTLMVYFMKNELTQFIHAYSALIDISFDSKTFYQKYHAWYLMIYHSIFVIDVTIGVISYTVASRWLNNRIKSVDSTLSGWVFALLCYPPINRGFTDNFIGYGRFDTHYVISNEYVLMLIMALIIFLFLIYVWSTLTLGFKFSNLTNRGIVDHGPYSYIRHPAYMTKNLAWWLDNTFVFSNLFATISLAVWNVIYIYHF